MFGDNDWLPHLTDEQNRSYNDFISNIGEGENLVIIEIGAGMTIPSIRLLGEQLLMPKAIGNGGAAYLIRINPNEQQVIRTPATTMILREENM